MFVLSAHDRSTPVLPQARAKQLKGSGEEQVEESEVRAVEAAFTQVHQTWRKRKRLCMDTLRTLGEAMSTRTDQLLEQYGVDTDEDCGQTLLGSPDEEFSSRVVLRGAEVLAEALTRSDLDGGIRWNCAESLGTLGEAAGNAAAFALAKALLQRKPGQVASETYVRTGLAHSLGRMGSAARGSGAVSLARALQDDRDVLVRRRAAMALGHLGPVAGHLGAQALARALKVDKDFYVRCRCAEALGAGVPTGEEEAKALIQAFLGNETDVRWRCAMSLGKLGPVAGKEGAAALLKAHSDQILAVREHAMRAANMLVTRCLDVLDELVHPYVRGQACWVLGSIGPREEAVEALVAVLLREEISGARRREVDVYLRRRAAEALGCQGAAVGALGALALKRAAEEDPDVYVQWHAAEVFARLPAKLQADPDPGPDAVHGYRRV
ncbi:Signal transduction protein (Fragment) [Durusdinium trenchii]|uniref:Signal transduction protein n=1 Tax=Durusdinium trenchii TaxID=1381693 RepID=A0ABP0SGF0_9DINO